jgi:hypothetical protein
MKWHRIEPGHYEAGPYTVTRHPLADTVWLATGPEMEPDVLWSGKNLAQDECRRAMVRRVEDPYGCEVVVGDVVIAGGKRAVIKAILVADGGLRTYVAQNARGRRKCMVRPEFPVVVP